MQSQNAPKVKLAGAWPHTPGGELIRRSCRPGWISVGEKGRQGMRERRNEDQGDENDSDGPLRCLRRIDANEAYIMQLAIAHLNS